VSEFPQIAPMLSYEDVAGAADWLVRAFGFEEVERFDHEGAVVHVTLRLGTGAVMLGRPGESYVNPRRLREQCEAAARMYSVPWVVDGVWVRVDDVEAHRERARDAGAMFLSEIEDGPEGRLYRVEDPEGHRWMFAENGA
jgi:uncharacterized glyoxalase superfamily protein PhnB